MEQLVENISDTQDGLPSSEPKKVKDLISFS
jgi:hypothetical protein